MQNFLTTIYKLKKIRDNKNPYDVDASKIAMAELYEKCSELTFFKYGKRIADAHKKAFNKTTALHKIKYKDIKTYYIQEVVDLSGGIFDAKIGQKFI